MCWNHGWLLLLVDTCTDPGFDQEQRFAPAAILGLVKIGLWTVTGVGEQCCEQNAPTRSFDNTSLFLLRMLFNFGPFQDDRHHVDGSAAAEQQQICLSWRLAQHLVCVESSLSGA